MTSPLEYIEDVILNIPNELVNCKVKAVVQTMKSLVLQAEPLTRPKRCDGDCCDVLLGCIEYEDRAALQEFRSTLKLPPAVGKSEQKSAGRRPGIMGAPECNQFLVRSQFWGA